MKILDYFRKKKEPPRIDTPYGPTTEWARQAAVRNMREDPEKRMAVLKLLVEQTGSVAQGELEFQRRFPELQGDE